jgi:hypothetical protein
MKRNTRRDFKTEKHGPEAPRGLAVTNVMPSGWCDGPDRLWQRFNGLPIEIGVLTGPSVDFGLADLTVKAAACIFDARRLRNLISRPAL